MRILFLLFSLLVLYELASLFIPIGRTQAGIAIISIALFLAAYSVFNAFPVDVKAVSIPLESISRPTRIVQISDTHLGILRNSGFLEKVASETRKLSPDIVVITGDLIDTSYGIDTSSLCILDSLRADVFAVSGNYELYDGLERFYRLLENTSVKVLDNKEAESHGIQLIGVSFSEEKGHLASQLGRFKVSRSRPSVLLYYNPSEYRAAMERGITLQLSGHTHAGQIFPFNFIIQAFISPVSGIKRDKGFTLYVSPGTGTWGPFMRLGSKNEISVIDLVPASRLYHKKAA